MSDRALGDAARALRAGACSPSVFVAMLDEETAAALAEEAIARVSGQSVDAVAGALLPGLQRMLAAITRDVRLLEGSGAAVERLLSAHRNVRRLVDRLRERRRVSAP